LFFSLDNEYEDTHLIRNVVKNEIKVMEVKNMSFTEDITLSLPPYSNKQKMIYIILFVIIFRWP
ncbi:MAG: hypothetical protein ACRD5R_19315, partial [Candidatus Acidiferrales bacterium]